MPSNRLAGETSPYLRQHKDNPVHWWPWSEAAFAAAREENKPILLSVGYSACHWCHVMAHESFENEAIARLMNEHFVNIKVDREERPDVDNLYQSALALMGEHGGWPLTMFLTPEGEPFFGGTYFPPTPRWGRPGFPQVLQQIATIYHGDRERIATNTAAVRENLAKLATPAAGEGLNDRLIDAAATAGLRLIDPFHGGTAGAPKFPQPVFFRFLWRAYRRTGARLFRDAVTLTLDALCEGGIYDHLGGGFARYATDEEWLVPHFEKMLYDNALLIDLLTEVGQATGSVLYQQRVTESIEWALRELRVGHPGDPNAFAFAAALDADSEGEEGKYYVWSVGEIDLLLGDRAALFKRVYDISRAGNWEGHNILHRRHARAGLLGPAEVEALAAARRILLAQRQHRVPPGRDDKVLADWNGLMIQALARAGVVHEQPAWLGAARAVFRFVEGAMVVDGRLRHAWTAGEARHPAVLDDYANMALAALTLHAATGEAAYLARARAWVRIADRHYWDGGEGGYFLSADDTGDLPLRVKTITDSATPSGNGTMAEVLARLYHVTGESGYRDRAERLSVLFSNDNTQYLLAIPGLLTAYDTLTRATEIVIVGAHQDPRTAALRAAAWRVAPTAIIQSLAAETPLPAGHPAHGKGPVDGQPAAYVCVGTRCGAPVTDPAALAAALAA